MTLHLCLAMFTFDNRILSEVMTPPTPAALGLTLSDNVRKYLHRSKGEKHVEGVPLRSRTLLRLLPIAECMRPARLALHNCRLSGFLDRSPVEDSDHEPETCRHLKGAFPREPPKSDEHEPRGCERSLGVN